VLGQAHTPRRRLLLLAAMAVAVLVAPAVGGANPSHSVSTLRARDAAIAAKSRAAVLGLYSLDQQLSAAHARLGSLQRQTASLRAERVTLEHALRIARRGTAVAQRGLALQIRTLYEQGSVEPLEIVFGAKSLDEAMTNIDNLNRAGAQSEAVLEQLQAAKKRLARASAALRSREAALAAATRDARAQESSLVRTRAQRSAYLGSLATQRKLTQRAIAGVVARAHAAAVRSAQIVHAAPVPVQSPAQSQSQAPALTLESAAAAPQPQSAPAPVGGGRELTVSATGYALGGTTATGLPVGWGVVAVDPSVIPLGTHMLIPGYGEAVAADTGGAIVGSTIDLWFPTAAQAAAWGRRTVTIVLH
jgi:cystine transport system substrate-binding protein